MNIVEEAYNNAFKSSPADQKQNLTEDFRNRAECLAKAKECVCGQREQDYGSPESSFSAIANLWNAYYGSDFTAKDVAMMMALLKIARISTGTATVDSFVDLAGYAACGCEIATELKSRSATDLTKNI